MKKIFRKIRYDLIRHNEIGKYLTYAIGEIILVVLGILIALQINNWNERSKANEKEKLILTEIVSDLSLNEKDTKVEIDSSFLIGRDSILRMIDHVIYHLENKLPYQVKLSECFYMIHQLPGIKVKESGFESLKSSGMDIIRNDSLRSAIGEYYTVTVKSTEEIYTELRDDFYNYMLKFPRTLFITKTNEQHDYIQVPVDYDELLENTEYIESLKMFSGIYYLNLIITKEYLESTSNLKQNIVAYLGEKE